MKRALRWRRRALRYAIVPRIGDGGVAGSVLTSLEPTGVVGVASAAARLSAIGSGDLGR